MAAPRCPTCRKPSPPREENPAFPFCRPRCRDVDLGKWLGEEFRIAAESADSDEDGYSLPTAPSTDDDDDDDDDDDEGAP
jgi:endogenous inhibitor of DNA gyrase (YacG/DUF329 family)